MYCRDTTDRATEHVAHLPGLRSYYAGASQITDRSLELLSGMATLVRVEIYKCLAVTNAGLVFLARLPELREVSLAALPGITHEGTMVFSPQVRVDYVP